MARKVFFIGEADEGRRIHYGYSEIALSEMGERYVRSKCGVHVKRWKRGRRPDWSHVNGVCAHCSKGEEKLFLRRLLQAIATDTDDASELRRLREQATREAWSFDALIVALQLLETQIREQQELALMVHTHNNTLVEVDRVLKEGFNRRGSIRGARPANLYHLPIAAALG